MTHPKLGLLKGRVAGLKYFPLLDYDPYPMLKAELTVAGGVIRSPDRTNGRMISLIAAIASENRALGKDNRLIYHISDDLKRFKEITSGHPIIMGRKTFESIGMPLPNRTNIIITRDAEYFVEEGEVVHSFEEALEKAKSSPGSDEIFVIGGGQIYQEAIKVADKLYLTIVEGNPDADTFFPPYSQFTKVTFEEAHESDGLKYKFRDLERY